MASNNFIDLHVHPSLKASLCRTTVGVTSWDEIRLDEKGLLGKILKGFEDVLRSQANLTQLKQGNVRIAVVALHGVELAFAERIIFSTLVPLASDLDSGLLQSVASGSVTYFDMLNRDANRLVADTQDHTKVHLVTSFKDISEITDDNVLILVPAVEGSHSFKNFRFDTSKIGTKHPQQNLKLEDENLSATDIKNIVNNFKTFREQYHPFYMTLTHLSRQPACAHAYGVRVRLQNKSNLLVLGKDKSFKPAGFALTDFGKAMIDASYTLDSKNKYTLIDVKHMSLVSRLQFYEYRKEKGYSNIPIIASHMGVTGISCKAIPVRWISANKHHTIDLNTISYHAGCKKIGYNGCTFNPWTINLFDEEIEHILDSNGMIGVSLDKRIVGAGAVYYEFFSDREYDYLRPYLTTHYDLSEYVPVPDERDPQPEEAPEPTQEQLIAADGTVEEDFPQVKNELPGIHPHIQFVANNILHIVKVGIQYFEKNGNPNNINAWNKIGIGSDLDGLIDPVYIKDNTSIDVTYYPLLEQQLITVLDYFISLDNSMNYKFDGKTTEQHVRQIMYDNAFNFLSENF